MDLIVTFGFLLSSFLSMRPFARIFQQWIHFFDSQEFLCIFLIDNYHTTTNKCILVGNKFCPCKNPHVPCSTFIFSFQGEQNKFGKGFGETTKEAICKLKGIKQAK